jgi:hypothetical protein
VKEFARAGDWSYRRLTASRRSLPRFVIIGAQRAGTTSLYHWLTRHDGFEPAYRKEAHYYDLHYGKGQDWYRAHFPLRRRGTMSGEGSPYLLFHPLAPARFARDLPATTVVIALLRNPVDRAISHHRHERHLGVEPLGLADAIAEEPTRLAGQSEVIEQGGASFAHQHFSYVARGEYASQLRRWFTYLPPESIHVFESSAIIGDAEEQNRLLMLFGLTPAQRLPFPRFNATATTPTDTVEGDELDVRARLAEHFRPHNEDLSTLIGRDLWT